MTVSPARESLAQLLQEAAKQTGSWALLSDQLRVPKNHLWRHAHPGDRDGNGKLYAQGLPRSSELEKIMDGLGLVLARQPHGGSMLDVGAAILRLSVARGVRSIMLAVVWAIYNEHRAWTKAPNAEDGE